MRNFKSQFWNITKSSKKLWPPGPTHPPTVNCTVQLESFFSFRWSSLSMIGFDSSLGIVLGDVMVLANVCIRILLRFIAGPSRLHKGLLIQWERERKSWVTPSALSSSLPHPPHTHTHTRAPHTHTHTHTHTDTHTHRHTTYAHTDTHT